ncbi:hypothetical protein VP01_1607g2 [Puccinia sorghi]|uniref:Uncharacterized protein n=1 Tax=Puccinia sorghi TaxID=27349 RepID=A0A0L6VH96_9BASI|nr:hypothetical protein VP01_1607g2 [Puccinia sorghi]
MWPGPFWSQNNRPDPISALNNPQAITSQVVVDAKMISPTVVKGDEQEDYTFECEDLSVNPSLEQLILHKISVSRGKQEVIWDSGASDNVTVRVSPDGPCDFITGTSTLRFAGINSMIVAVKKVYYCENARSKLISVVAFKKANTQFRVGGNFDSISLLSHRGTTLLHSVFVSPRDTPEYPKACIIVLYLL